MNRPATSVRRMEEADLPRARELSEQLGYPADAAGFAQRYARIAGDASQALFVAEGGEGRGAIAGWLHVQERCVLEAPAYAEIGGLVVDAAARRAGAGRALLAAAEAWARQRGVGRLVVRSNVLRDAAHAFYPAVGFSPAKTQRVYERAVGGGGPGPVA